MERSDWQFGLSTHRERCKYRSKYALDNSLFCDVEFLVVDYDGNKVIVPANKYPLAVCSPVFEAMFYGKLAETSSPIHIPDCIEEGLREVLRFAHLEESKLAGNNVMEVLYLAKKYMMPALEEKCQHFIQNEVGPEYVLNILPQVQQMGDENLEKRVWEVVDASAGQVILSNSFLNMSRELLYQVLQRDTLIIQELNLFIAVDRWAAKRIEEDIELVCNGETKRAIFGEDIIRLIRFPIMTQKEIAEVVLPCRVLSADEMAELFSLCSGTTSTTTIFSQLKRSCSSGDPLISDVRFPHDTLRAESWSYGSGKHYDCLSFSVNKTVNLVALQLFGSKDNAYCVKLKINKNITNECISEISSSYATEKEKIDALYYGFTVTLDKPVRLDPSVVYSLQAEISGPNSWSGHTGKGLVCAGDFKISYTNCESSTNCTTCERGQFPSLVIQAV